MDVFERYKPFRNRFRSLARDDALRVIWAYSQHLQFPSFRIPTDIEVHRFFYTQKPPQKWIAEWELEILTKEVILNAGMVARSGKTLRTWRTLSEMVNNLKELENSVYGQHSSDNSIFVELVRIAHRQFEWQSNSPNSVSTVRYYKIFNQPEINQICQQRLGLTVNEVYLCGIGLLGHFLSQPWIVYPVSSQLPGISVEKIECFLNFACRTIVQLKKALTSEQQYNSRFAYAYSSLREFPLIRMQFRGVDSIMCPLVTLLYWRLTGGLYYELRNDPEFSRPFGGSFQGYVGEVIGRACTNARITLLAEQEYGSKQKRKDSVDWIVSDGDTAAFLECKSKRLSWNAKTSLEDGTALETDLGYMAQAVIQVYKSIRDYKGGQYKHFAYSDRRRIYPVIVSLENWHMFAPPMGERLDVAVREGLQKQGIPVEVLNQMPYSIWAIDELEVGMQIVNSVGLQQYLDGKINDREMVRWEWMPYITHQYKNYLPPRKLFDGEFNEIFSTIRSSGMAQ